MDYSQSISLIIFHFLVFFCNNKLNKHLMAFKIEMSFEAPLPPIAIKKKNVPVFPTFSLISQTRHCGAGKMRASRPGHAIPILVEMKSIELIIGA